MTIKELANRMRAVNVHVLVNDALQQNSQKIIELNKAQMAVGKKPTDEYFQRYRSESYARYKQSIGSKAPFGIPNLLLTGAFYRGMKFTIKGKTYYLYSTDSKSEHLRVKYSPFGLSSTSKEKAKEYNTRTLAKLWMQEIGLNDST